MSTLASNRKCQKEHNSLVNAVVTAEWLRNSISLPGLRRLCLFRNLMMLMAWLERDPLNHERQAIVDCFFQLFGGFFSFHHIVHADDFKLAAAEHAAAGIDLADNQVELIKARRAPMRPPARKVVRSARVLIALLGLHLDGQRQADNYDANKTSFDVPALQFLPIECKVRNGFLAIAMDPDRAGILPVTLPPFARADDIVFQFVIAAGAWQVSGRRVMGAGLDGFRWQQRKALSLAEFQARTGQQVGVGRNGICNRSAANRRICRSDRRPPIHSCGPGGRRANAVRRNDCTRFSVAVHAQCNGL